jgi:hypothetical protein
MKTLKYSFIFFLLFIFISIDAFAQNLNVHNKGDKYPPLILAQSGAALFKGEGVHQCQSEKSIGHKCTVSGTEFSSCDHAAKSLKITDCCRNSEFGGVSIGFTMGKCSKWYK